MPDYEKNEQAAAAKADKSKKDVKKSKLGSFARIGKWFREMKVELKKVQGSRKSRRSTTPSSSSCAVSSLASVSGV